MKPLSLARILAGSLLALALVQANAAPPPHRGGHPPPGAWSGGYWGAGYRGAGYWGPHDGWHGAYRGYWGPRVGVYVGSPAYWGTWPYSLGWGPINPWPYSPPLVVTVPAAPPVVVQQPAAPVDPAASYWYYCTQPAGYYPYVQNCEVPWMKVVPQVPGESNSPPRLAP